MAVPVLLFDVTLTVIVNDPLPNDAVSTEKPLQVLELALGKTSTCWLYIVEPDFVIVSVHVPDDNSSPMSTLTCKGLPSAYVMVTGSCDAVD